MPEMSRLTVFMSGLVQTDLAVAPLVSSAALVNAIE